MIVLPLNLYWEASLGSMFHERTFLPNENSPTPPVYLTCFPKAGSGSLEDPVVLPHACAKLDQSVFLSTQFECWILAAFIDYLNSFRLLQCFYKV